MLLCSWIRRGLCFSVLSIAIAGAGGFSPLSLKKTGPSLRWGTQLRAALTPVGPFCPFRSSAAVEFDKETVKLHKLGSVGFSDEMESIMSELQTGGQPDKFRLKRAADEIETSVNDWENLLKRLRSSQDFQTIEFSKLTENHLESFGVSADSVAQMMKWQGACLRALAYHTPPPMPPAGLDLERMIESDDKEKPSMLTAMASIGSVTTEPFDPKAVCTTEPLEDEYVQLVHDHQKLIERGSTYGSFSSAKKIEYILDIERIQDRWEQFFGRFSLTEQLDKKFLEQCDDFLENMSISEQEYKDLLKKTHKQMITEAAGDGEGPLLQA